MRQVIAGNGSDSTTATLDWLAANDMYRMPNLFLIGELYSPTALWLTDYESPLVWSCWGTFQPARCERTETVSQVGLAVASINFTLGAPDGGWGDFPQNTTQLNPLQIAMLGMFDNMRFRNWTCYMPTPGDANTLGACEEFGGFIGDTEYDRGEIRFTVNSYLAVVNQQVPTNVIENTNTLASYKGASPPAGLPSLPEFNVIAGSSETEVIGYCTGPTAGQQFDFVGGDFLCFNFGSGETLGGVFSVIQGTSKQTIGGQPCTIFTLYSPLPWPPTPGSDTFFLSQAWPLTGGFEFPYVPDPTGAI